MTRIGILGAIVLLAGCASAGVRVQESQLAQFHPGQTTYSEVVKALGPPSTSTLSSTGERMIVYSFFHYQTRPESFIPYVGPFVGGADTSNSNVVLVFDQHSILQRYDSSAGGMGVSTGILSGAKPEDRIQVRP